MSQWLLIGVLLLAMIGVSAFCVFHDGEHIQQDVFSRTSQAVASANIVAAPGAIAVDGRDVTLTGVRGSAIVSDSTRALVQSVWGVRDPVHVRVTEPPPPPPPPPLSAEAQKVEVDLTKFLEGKTIRFDTASDNILPDGKVVLDQVFRILATAPAVAVDITGHTDNDGDLSFNVDLSRKRAVAVRQYLIAKGIQPARLAAEGFGSAKPLAPNDTPENRAKNRRIEFHAVAR